MCVERAEPKCFPKNDTCTALGELVQELVQPVQECRLTDFAVLHVLQHQIKTQNNLNLTRRHHNIQSRIPAPTISHQLCLHIPLQSWCYLCLAKPDIQ